uniref:Uncharacterized protein n=1 Tax=Globodera pallida TaxID=36090 RepID=A0A183C721_GLOPA
MNEQINDARMLQRHKHERGKLNEKKQVYDGSEIQQLRIGADPSAPPTQLRPPGFGVEAAAPEARAGAGLYPVVMREGLDLRL